MTPEQIEKIEREGTILTFEYGSRAIGTNTVDSDHDLMSIVVEPRYTVIGLDEWDGGQRSTSGQNRSLASDIDTTVYSLRKWARLAAKGNPTVLTALYVPEYLVKTELGQALLDNRDLFVSREAGHRHLGYMRSQRDAMIGKRNKRTNRPELVEKFGYDVKFAYEMLRLGIQGKQFMEMGKLQLPLAASDRLNLMDVRDGHFSKDYVLAWSDVLDDELAIAIENSSLPETTDRDRLNQLLIDLHSDFWEHGNF